MSKLEAFLRESNFLALSIVTLQDLNNVQRVFAPGHQLRDRPGLDVRVGDYIAPAGGVVIRDRLCSILNDACMECLGPTPWETHLRFEMLHPYTDGNGRTGRILWAWHMQRLGRDPFRLGFLHAFYYQTLEASGT
jgi:Fic/DOC family